MQPSVGRLQHRVAPNINSRNIVARHAASDTGTIRVIFRARIVQSLSSIKRTQLQLISLRTIKNIPEAIIHVP